jgi:hypothetical protein
MTTPAGDGNTPHRARNLFDGIDLAPNTMKVRLGSQAVFLMIGGNVG